MSELQCLPLYINGEFLKTEKRFSNISPLNGQIISEVSEASEEHVNLAVKSAKDALAGEWGKQTPDQLATYLYKIADGIEARFEEFVKAEVADTGRPEKLARTLDVPRAINNFRVFADLAKTRVSDSSETPLSGGATLFNFTAKKPLGVIAVISPWNLPLLLLTWKLGPALAVGNTVVCKPSEETPSSATLLAAVFHDVGIPKGVFNLVHGFGTNSAGDFICRHKDIDAISFTGASTTGRHIMAAASRDVKELSFELGGKNAAIIFEDADFDKAIEGITRSSFFNTGQVCMCTERVYVHRSIYDRFVTALKEKAEALTIGYPNDSTTDLGPLISKTHQEKVLSYFSLAKEEGATIITGNEKPHFNDERSHGFFVKPTIWVGLDDNSRCMQEEVFGPICHISPFDDEDEVIARANNSQYGLASSVWTQNVNRIHRISKQLHVGIVWINTWYARDLRTPFGGAKHSGIGREGGHYSLDFYSEITNVSIRYE